MNEPNLACPCFISHRLPALGQSLMKYFEPLENFVQKLRKESSPRLPIDFYTCSFICEFLTLIIIFVGFSSFVVSYLIWMISQFMFMVLAASSFRRPGFLFSGK